MWFIKKMEGLQRHGVYSKGASAAAEEKRVKGQWMGLSDIPLDNTHHFLLHLPGDVEPMITDGGGRLPLREQRCRERLLG
jgi:hypothetical protein